VPALLRPGTQVTLLVITLSNFLGTSLPGARRIDEHRYPSGDALLNNAASGSPASRQETPNRKQAERSKCTPPPPVPSPRVRLTFSRTSRRPGSTMSTDMRSDPLLQTLHSHYTTSNNSSKFLLLKKMPSRGTLAVGAKYG